MLLKLWLLCGNNCLQCCLAGLLHVMFSFLQHSKACLHVPSPSPCPSPSPSKFNIVSMEMDCLTDIMGSVSILPIKRTVTIGTMLNFDSDGDGDGDRHGDGDGDGTCKQTFTLSACLLPPSKKTFRGNATLTTQSEFNTIMINRPHSCYFEWVVRETAMYLNVYITNQLLLLPTSISNQPQPPLYMWKPWWWKSWKLTWNET